MTQKLRNMQLEKWRQEGLIPAHVPEELVRDFDYYSAETGERTGVFDVYQKYRQLFDGSGDIFYTPHNGGHWIVTRYTHLEEIYADPDRFQNHKNMIPPSPEEGLGLVNYDGARHTAFRALLQPFFSPKVAAGFEPAIRSLAQALIKGFAGDGRCEFVEQFAQKLPSMLVMKYILDLPEQDVPYLMPFVHDVAKSGQDVEAYRRAFLKLREYISQKVLPDRRANPRSDVVSAIVHGRAEGGRLPTENEIVSSRTPHSSRLRRMSCFGR